MSSIKPIETARTPDLRSSWGALQRAAQRARLVAAQTGTAVVVERNGVLEHVYPQLDAPDMTQLQEPSAAYRKPA